MILRLVSLVCLLQLSFSEDDKKWVWKKQNNERSGNSRYQVIEDGPSRPEFLDFDRPDRPLGLQHEYEFPDRPFPNRPGTGVFGTNERPDAFGHYPSGGYRPHHPHQHHSDQGILTGPVPSWEREPPFKHYDKCKCAEKFNCNSPGISYVSCIVIDGLIIIVTLQGQCDVGKQYCCYNSNQDGVLGGPLPSRPIHSPGNGVLVGPGGPSGYPHRPQHNPGVLVGPGGPTGVIGRPPTRPFDRPILEPGLGGPGAFRPPEVPYGGSYGRRSDPKKTKDVK